MWKCGLLAMLVVGFFSQVVKADTLSLVGGTSGNWEIGWWGEAWDGEHWCGDTLVHDPSPDTLIDPPDTLRDLIHNEFVHDTVKTTIVTNALDSLAVTTTTIETETVLSDSANDSLVDLITTRIKIIDSSVFVPCAPSDFLADTGGIAEGSTYLNYHYKVRNFWAQLPFVWKNWEGYDSATISPYTTLLITYKGILPIHQLNMSFIYATWGNNADTMKTFLKRGDGLGILESSPDAWKTVVIQIPDSVSMPSITGIVLAVESVGDEGGETSDVGTIKISEISLIASEEPVIHKVVSRGILHDRYHFIPKTSGNVEVAVYSLSGALLDIRTLRVDPLQMYSVHKLAKLPGGTAGQIRIVKIRGAGVNLNEKIW
jgi:hypothetical protein